MRRMMTYAVSMMMALAMLMAPEMVAQTRSTGGGATRTTSSQSGTRSSGSNSGSSSSRSSGSSSSSQVRSSSGSSSSSSRSSGTSVQQDNRSRSTGTTSSGSSSSRNSGSSSSGSSSSRSSGSNSGSSTSTVRSGGSTGSGSSVTSSYTGSDSQQDRNRNSGSTSGSSATRSSGSTSTSGSSTTRSSGSTSGSGSTVRSSGSTSGNNGSTVRSSGSTSGSTGSTVRSSGSTSGSGSTVRSSGSTSATGGTVRSTNVSRNGLSYNAAEDNKAPKQEAYRDEGYNYRYHDDMRVDDSHNMYRVPPRQREPMDWHRAGYFWGDHPHYYGYRIHSLPPSWRRINHWGIDYYYCDGIYYRSYGGMYVVCRPPYGTPLERAIDRAILRTIRFAYYCDTYRTYSRSFDYYNVIARQNLIIAQQNARIIAQNAAYAINSNRALTAYELAERLGLVQSYAYADAEYFYQDGVFYTISNSGVFSTIVPPAGALVTSLPDDYEIIVMNGIEYYMVDNTVYRTTLFEGMPYLEVLGQMYGSLYNQYNVYR